MDPKENDFQAKKEAESKFPKIASSSRHWSSYNNPRIVRASRAFGGKDRHSKVCTVRGLRDRRIRLSVPTAIQLYDLQDKLGLSQPSKVVDWLLDATRSDIDKLPPLPSLNFTQFQESGASTSQYSLPHCFLTPNQQKNLGLFKGGIKENDQGEKRWMDQQNQEGLGGFVAQNFFPLRNTSFQSSYPNMHYNSSNTFNWDLPNLSLSQFGGGFSFPARTDDPLSIASGSHPYFGPFGTNTPPSFFPSFPSYFTPSSDNHGMRKS